MSKRPLKRRRDESDDVGEFIPGKPFKETATKARREPPSPMPAPTRASDGKAMPRRAPNGAFLPGAVTEFGIQRKAKATAKRDLKPITEDELRKATRRVIDEAKAREATIDLACLGGFNPEPSYLPQRAPREVIDNRVPPKDFGIIEKAKHYNKGKIEVWDFIADQDLGFLEGNVIKYLTRYRFKNGIEDLKKARAYLTRLIKQHGGE